MRSPLSSRFSAIRCLFYLIALALPAAALAVLHADMQRALVEEGLTGAVWATVIANGTIAVDAAGVANARSGERMTADHRVYVGSVAKVVLATGVLRLITEGRLSLDSPVAALLPTLAFDNRWAASDPIRVRHLLSHTAGLDNLRLWQAFSTQPHADTPLGDAFAGDPSLLRLRSRPGSRYVYSNMSYALLGMAIESVTGERYERWLDANVLRPLSMRDSTFAFVSQTGARADPHLAMGHFEDDVTHAAVPTYLRPAGQFTTTATDMATFAQFLMGDGRIDGHTFIDPALMAALGEPAGTEAALAGLSIGHGLALARRDRHGVVGWCHPGTTIGFRARLCVYPDQGKAFFVAINTDSETADYDRLDARLIRALDVQPVAPLSVGTAPANMADWEGIYVPAPNAMASFAWLDRVFNFVNVRWDGTRLHVKPFQSAERVLIPKGGLLFQATDRTTPSHVLLTAPGGARVLSDGLHSYERASLVTMVALWASLAAGLAGLIWIVVTGLGRLLIGRLKPSGPMFVPLLAVIALLLPLPFFFRQSFLQLGDVTTASVLLAVVTGALPIAMIVGLVLLFRRRCKGAIHVLDATALLGVLQWTIVLAAWKLVPLRLWV